MAPQRETVEIAVATGLDRRARSVARARWQEALLRTSSLDPTTRLVGALIGLRLNMETGWCWPSHRKIAEEVGCSERTSKRSVARLQADGWIICQVGGGKDANRYSIDWQRWLGGEVRASSGATNRFSAVPDLTDEIPF